MVGNRISKVIGRAVFAVAAFCAFLCLLCWIAAPDLDKQPDAIALEDIDRVNASRAAVPARDTSLRPRIQKDVDYTEGAAGAWWPKGNPPILVDEWNTDGTPKRLIEVDGTPLPPVHERTGSEPVVMVGVDDQARTEPLNGKRRYGGTWIEGGAGSLLGLAYSGSAASLVRWSPQGDPVVPHVARAWSVGLPADIRERWLAGLSPEARTAWAKPRNRYAAYDFRLRKGMKWSNGKPYSVVDILYWWWHETNNSTVAGRVRDFMRCAGLPGRIWMYEVDAGTGEQRPLYARVLNPPPETIETVRVNGTALSLMTVTVERDGKPVSKQINAYRFLVTFTRPGDRAEDSTFDHLRPMAPSERPNPYGIFIRKLATPAGMEIAQSPAHYLWRFHPDSEVGDRATREAEKKRRRVSSDRLLYELLKKPLNPEIPRIWPWIVRKYKADPPQDAYRNPYYWAVDEWGNQLPYLDHKHFVARDRDMMVASVASGGMPFWGGTMREHIYEQLMAQRETGQYDVYHWYRADRSLNAISFNLFRRVDPDRPETARKRELLRDIRFRRALSLAIKRQEICDAEFYGLTEPSQNAPGPASRFYYEHETPRDPNDPYLREAYRSYIDYDPRKANELLDEIGLTKRDLNGFRTFPDGTRLMLFVDTYKNASLGPLRLMCLHWAEVGVQVVPKIQEARLYWTRKDGLQHDMTMFPGEVEYEAILEPRLFVPTMDECNYAIPFARYYAKGGLRGALDEAIAKGALPDGIAVPPTDPAAPLYPLRRAMEIYDRIVQTGDAREQETLFREIQEIAASNLWTVAPCHTPPVPTTVRRDAGNVPALGVDTFKLMTPGNCGIETWFLKRPDRLTGDTPQAERWIRKRQGEWENWERQIQPSIRAAIAVLSPVTEAVDTTDGDVTATRAGERVGSLLRTAFLIVGILLVAMVFFRHPYLLRRLLIMIPTLLVISIIVFTAIQLPPGDFLTSLIMRSESIGEQADLEKMEDLRRLFHLDESMPQRYGRWIGFYWFLPYSAEEKVEATAAWEQACDRAREQGVPEPSEPGRGFFRSENKGLLQGHLGRRMEDGRLVNDIIGDRILMTLAISIGTLLVTWAIAIPVGIYSAVRQYSVGDYVLTTLGFIGMCVPSFLLAILLLAVCRHYLGLDVTGLLSPEYSAQDAWDGPKILDLLKHIWVPILILAITGTAGMIRVMRGNLLDELKKPYVTTARAKGVRPVRLLLKYPVRMALNPFVSGIGHVFRALLSGGTIVAVVLSLPTVGELMLKALLDEEMYVGGSMLMILSMLGVVGVLVSDLLLLWLDPRIRYGKGSR